MRRIYDDVLRDHFSKNRQMLFLSGPRQVGKTTTSLQAGTPESYLNWDNHLDRAIILGGSETVMKHIGGEKLKSHKHTLVFDEIHKYPHWKRFLKGFFDVYERETQIIVTGSARLDVYKRGGDSLMGRYFLYRIHPLSVREIIDPTFVEQEIRPPTPIKDEDWNTLLKFGGFPEPYLQRNTRFWTQWKKLRIEQLFKEDLRDLSRIQELGQIRLLADLLAEQAGKLVEYTNLANKVQVTSPTVQRWIKTLSSLYYCFTLQPWSKNIGRSLLKQPKVFLWDWSLVDDLGARHENLVASHLLKATQFWNDAGLGDYGLYFIRDKEKREVDFLVTKNKKPWFLVEVKSSSHAGISPSLYRFQQETKAPHAFQVCFDLPYVSRDCFEETRPIIVPARTFLSQLI